MYKITVERIDAEMKVVTRWATMSKAEADKLALSGVKVTERDSRDKDYQFEASIPVIDSSTRTTKVYEQTVEALDLGAVINAVNK